MKNSTSSVIHLHVILAGFLGSCIFYYYESVDKFVYGGFTDASRFSDVILLSCKLQYNTFGDVNSSLKALLIDSFLFLVKFRYFGTLFTTRQHFAITIARSFGKNVCAVD